MIAIIQRRMGALRAASQGASLSAFVSDGGIQFCTEQAVKANRLLKPHFIGKLVNWSDDELDPCFSLHIPAAKCREAIDILSMHESIAICEYDFDGQSQATRMYCIAVVPKKLEGKQPMKAEAPAGTKTDLNDLL